MKIYKVFVSSLTFASSVSAQLFVSCTESASNPIKDSYPASTITGTMNGTIAVVPIPLTLARQIVPSQYGILAKAYEALLPNFPADSYPLIVRTGCDHDTGPLNGAITIPDFLTAHFEFPFVDLLNDGYSSFNYNHYEIVSENILADIGLLQYGGVATPGLFSPSSQAYKSQPNTGGTSFSATELTGKPIISESFLRNPSNSGIGPWSLDFYKNVTNQPQFFAGPPLFTCDNQRQLYNTSVTNPIGVHGNISIAASYLPTTSTFTNVYGIQVMVAFVEKSGVQCQSLQGYDGTGSGD